MELLLIEDDGAIGKPLERGLEEAGHPCRWVKDGVVGLELAASQRFDAVILDLMLPGLSGLELLRELRRRGHRTPVVALTALGAVEERVAGLEAGADDYVVKPFALPELLARLAAVARRAAPRASPTLAAGGLTLDLAARKASRGGREVDFSPTEFKLVELLARHAGQVVTRRMLCEHLWSADWEGATNVIEVNINRVRAKLAKAGADPSPIETVRGRGYLMLAGPDLPAEG